MLNLPSGKGFFAAYGADHRRAEILARVQRISETFNIQVAEYIFGSLYLVVWGNKCHTWPDASNFIVGSNDAVANDVTRTEPEESGMFCLVRISSDGSQLDVKNDWCGAVPLYYGTKGAVSCISTLEDLVVAGLDLSQNDFSETGLAELLTFGHFVLDRTLYEPVRTVHPDSYIRFREGRLEHCRPRMSLFNERREDYSSESSVVDEFIDHMDRTMCKSAPLGRTLVVPLSGGLDSRYLCADAAERGCDVTAFTYANTSTNLAFAKMVAKQLRVPWREIKVPTRHLAEHTSTWARLFGSSMHFHGMYQMQPILEAAGQDSVFLSGYLGDRVAGAVTDYGISSLTCSRDILYRVSKAWPADQINQIIDLGVEELLNESRERVDELLRGYDIDNERKAMLTDFWTRQRNLISFSPQLLSYTSDVAVPYSNLGLIRFCFHAPLALLRHRRLQKLALIRRFPAMAKIPGTFTDDAGPLLAAQSGPLRRYANRLQNLPRSLSRRFNAQSNTLSMSSKALLAHGKDCFPYLSSKFVRNGSNLIKAEGLESLLDKAIKGDKVSIAYLQRIQPILMRMSQA
jgi:hypothetical protein